MPCKIQVIDYHLMNGSAALDLGMNAGAPETDFDSEVRWFNGNCDIGVDEFYDTDYDGLSDWLERSYDGDPWSYDPYPGGGDLNASSEDTDGDGINDATEVNLGSNAASAGSVPSSSEVWVQFDYSSYLYGTELGTSGQPFDTLAEGVTCVTPAGTVKIKGDTEIYFTSEKPRITKAMRIEASGGPVRIGAP